MKTDNKCKKCGCSTSALADNFFIPKCYCAEIIEQELDDRDYDEWSPQ